MWAMFIRKLHTILKPSIVGVLRVRASLRALAQRDLTAILKTDFKE